MKISTMFQQIDSMEVCHETIVAIGFTLNNIAEIDHSKGRLYGEGLVRNIADMLLEKLSDKLFFYRLEGMRFMAIQASGCGQSAESCVRQISDIICAEYRRANISVIRPCSFAVMEYARSNLAYVDFMEQMVTLIEIAKRDTDHLFVGSSQKNIEKAQQMSNMLLILNNDVVDNMANFRMVIQPILSAKDNAIIGGEALLC